MINTFLAYLTQPLAEGGAETQIFLDRITTKTGETMATADFATLGRGILTINPDGDGNTSYPEWVSFTAVAADSVTGASRGLSAKSNSVVTANKRFHPTGTPVVISFGVHNLEDIIDYIDDTFIGAVGSADHDTAGTVKLTEDLGTKARAMASLVAETTSPGMTLTVEAFSLSALDKDVAFVGGTTGTMVAPVTNPRIDLIVYSTVSSTQTIRTGTEGASPTKPTPTAGDIVLAEVYHRVGETVIKDNDDSTNGYIKRWYFPHIYNPNVVPAGIVSPYAGRSAPDGYLLCDGTAVSRTANAALFAAICPSGTFTVTIASPAVFSRTAHGIVEGDKIHFTTTGALPTGLAANTDYFVISAGLTADAFQVSATRGGAAVNSSGSQSGVHTVYSSAWGKGDGSTTFNVPDYRGLTPYGYKSSDDNFDALNVPNDYDGEKTHTLTTDELQHSTAVVTTINGGSAGGSPIAWVTSVGAATSSASAHNNLPPYVVTNFIIKT